MTAGRPQRKPVLVLQNMAGDDPAYLGTWLAGRGIGLDLRDAGRGDAFPSHLDDHAALAVLGGEMSANDPLPHLRRAEALIRIAFDRRVPCIGHCLGGQLMARVLGARVVASPEPEIGWQPMTVADSAAARDWLGAPGEAFVYHWHYEAFELPAGAEPLASSAACPHQAFALGPHLAMQFHVEADAAKIDRWSREDGARWAAVQGRATVQDGAAMRAATPQRLAAQRALADRIYARWWSMAAA